MPSVNVLTDIGRLRACLGPHSRGPGLGLW
jgi:hypothetical protein